MDLDHAATSSKTYTINCNLAVPLDCEVSACLLPVITSEIQKGQCQIWQRQAYEEHIAQARSRCEATKKRRIAKKRKVEQVQQSKVAKQQMRALTHLQGRFLILICSVCGGPKLFSENGFKEHSTAKHPEDKPMALQACVFV